MSDIDWIFEIAFAKFYFSLVTQLVMKVTDNTIQILIWRGKGVKFCKMLNQVGLKLNQLLVYADDVNLLGDNIDTT
jgi:hypothetical protein